MTPAEFSAELDRLLVATKAKAELQFQKRLAREIRSATKQTRALFTPRQIEAALRRNDRAADRALDAAVERRVDEFAGHA